MRKTQRAYYNDQIEENKSNLKHQWTIIKTLINKQKKVKSPVSKFKIEGKLVTDKQEISDSFVDFFSDIGEKLDDAIPKSRIDPLKSIKAKYTINMFLIPVDEQEITKTIKNLKDCAVGWDCIPAKILKENLVVLVPIITHLINASFLAGCFPDELKRANLIPIFKSGDSETLGNYDQFPC